LFFIFIISFLENSIRGLDEDETDFLGRIDQARADKQRELKRMEQEEIEELKISFFLFFIRLKIFLRRIFFSLTLYYTKHKRN